MDKVNVTISVYFEVKNAEVFGVHVISAMQKHLAIARI